MRRWDPAPAIVVVATGGPSHETRRSSRNRGPACARPRHGAARSAPRSHQPFFESAKPPDTVVIKLRHWSRRVNPSIAVNGSLCLCFRSRPTSTGDRLCFGPADRIPYCQRNARLDSISPIGQSDLVREFCLGTRPFRSLALGSPDRIFADSSAEQRT